MPVNLFYARCTTGEKHLISQIKVIVMSSIQKTDKVTYTTDSSLSSLGCSRIGVEELNNEGNVSQPAELLTKICDIMEAISVFDLSSSSSSSLILSLVSLPSALIYFTTAVNPCDMLKRFSLLYSGFFMIHGL